MSGVVAAGHELEARAGARMLRAGGNAVDAAVAGTFTSFVVEPGRVHVGGCGMATVAWPGGDVPAVYDFFGAMPGLGGIPPEALDFFHVDIDFGDAVQRFYVGRASVAVPGNIFGLCRLAVDHGRLPLTELLAPAIEHAAAGVRINAAQADTCRIIAPVYTATPSLAAIFAPGGKFVVEGDTYFVPGMAEALREIADRGEEVFRRGALAQAIVRDQEARGGLITDEDLATYEVEVNRSIRAGYRGYDVWLPPPSSSGGALVALGLDVLSRWNVAGEPFGSAGHLTMLADAMAMMERSRDEWEAYRGEDPATAIDRFLAPHRREKRARTAVGAGRARSDDQPFGRGETTHVSAVDVNGFAATITNSSGIASGYVVPGSGLILNSILGEVDLNPEGFHLAPPGARLQTMMTPLIVTRDGRTRWVLGSGGSSRIRTALLQVLCALIDYDMALEETVDAPRVHWEAGVFHCEAGFDPAAVDELEAKGYTVHRWRTRSGYFGGVHGVGIDPAHGGLCGAGDDRRDGAVEIVI